MTPRGTVREMSAGRPGGARPRESGGSEDGRAAPPAALFSGRPVLRQAESRSGDDRGDPDRLAGHVLVLPAHYRRPGAVRAGAAGSRPAAATRGGRGIAVPE